MVPHTTHCSHLIHILGYGEILDIPFTDHCERSSEGQEWIVYAVIACIIFKHYCTCTLVPCWWWCEPVHMPIMTSICCIVWLPFRWPCAWPTLFSFGIRRHCNPDYTCKSPLFCVGALSLIKVLRLLLVLGLTVKYLYTRMYFYLFKYFITIIIHI